MTEQPSPQPIRLINRALALVSAAPPEFHPDARTLTQTRAAAHARRVVNVVAAFVSIILIIGAFTPADRIVTGQGKIQPTGKVQIVNHPVGGKVTRIFVRDGQHVSKGDNLIALDRVTAEAELNKLQLSSARLQLACARLSAEIDNSAAIAFPPEAAAQAPDAAREQQTLFDDHRALRAQQQRSLENDISKASAAIAQYQDKVQNNTAELRLAIDQERAWAELQRKGYFPKLRLIQAQRDILRLRSDASATQAALANALTDRATAQAKLDALSSATRGKNLDDLTDQKARLAEVTASLAQYKNQLANLVITAPSDGYVEALAVNNPGQSVEHDQELLHIVPDNRDFTVAVIVSNKDIAHIKPGQAATMKFRAYEFQRYGKLDGVVETIATDAQAPPSSQRTGAPDLAYRVLVRPAQNYLANTPDYPIQSGMLADVDFYVGHRTLLGYVADTLMRVRDEAFRE